MISAVPIDVCFAVLEPYSQFVPRSLHGLQFASTYQVEMFQPVSQVDMPTMSYPIHRRETPSYILTEATEDC
jgi:hypothetical protein